MDHQRLAALLGLTRGRGCSAPYQTKYVWGYLHSALEVDGQHAAQALFSSSVNLATSGKFLEQIQQSDPSAQHVVIWDQAGFHPRAGHATVPTGVHVLSLPPYSPELNPWKRSAPSSRRRVQQSLADDGGDRRPPSARVGALWKIPQRVAQLRRGKAG